MGTYETKSAQIEAIRRGDVDAIKEWMDCRPQNEYAVEKLIVNQLLAALHEQQKFEPMSKEDLVSKILVCESALRVIRATLKAPVGQAMVVMAKENNLPRSTATAYDDEDIEMMIGISDITLAMSTDQIEDFLRDMGKRTKQLASREKKKKPPTRPSSS